MTPTPDVAVIGGGLLGRCLAWRAARAGARVALYDAAGPEGKGSAAWAAAGMIAPSAEASEVHPQIVAMGRHSLSLWPRWLNELPFPVFYRDSGTVVTWHPTDAREALQFQRDLSKRDPGVHLRHASCQQLAEMEPVLSSSFQEAFYLAADAQVDNRGFLRAVAAAMELSGVECRWQTIVHDDEPLPVAGVVVDCRGMGATKVFPQLRGVRGEIARLHAPEIELQHMVRLLHPRFSIYIAPRAEGVLVVGATSLESVDYSPVSVRGALELLSSAFSVLPALGEARILEFDTQVRPALPDNLPAFHYDLARSVLRINGLYRHGFLLTPTLVEEALSLLALKGRPKSSSHWPCLRDTNSDIPTRVGRDEASLCSYS